MLNNKVFSYKISIERTIQDLIELRFKYVLERTGLSVEEFIGKRLRLNGKELDVNSIVQPNDILEYSHLRSDESKMDIHFDILYEDDFILAIDKPDFMPVIPRSSHYFNSVVVQLREQFKNDELTPLHRLDIETTGVLLVAKKLEITSAFHKLFREKEIRKTYNAIVYGHFPKSLTEIKGHIEKDTNSKIYSKFKLDSEKIVNSHTIIHSIEHHEHFSCLELEPITGKTNQLRIHLASQNHPIIGDKKYYFDEDIYIKWLETKDHYLEKMILPSQALHAREIEFKHPLTGEMCKICSNSDIIDQYLRTVNAHFGN